MKRKLNGSAPVTRWRADEVRVRVHAISVPRATKNLTGTAQHGYSFDRRKLLDRERERERERERRGEGEKGDRYDSWTEKIVLYIIFVIFFNSLETVSSCFIKKRFFITFVQWLASGKFIDILYYWKITNISNLTHRSRIKFESERCNYATARRGLRIIRLDLMN